MRLMALAALLGGALFPLSPLSAAPASAEAVLSRAPELATKVSVRALGVPLPKICEELTPEPGKVVLKVDPDLQELKATVVVTDQPAAEVLSRLAGVFGAEWVLQRQDATPDIIELTLQRSQPVAEWLRRWRRTREEAEMAAREHQFAAVKQLMLASLARLDEPFPVDQQGRERSPDGIIDVPAARFLRALPSEALDVLVGQLAGTVSARGGGVARLEPPPLAYHYSELSPPQRQILAEWMTERYHDDPSRRSQALSALGSSHVLLSTMDGISTSVTLELPDGRRIVGHATGTAPSPENVEALLQDLLLKGMGRGQTPPNALLGAVIDPDGQFEPEVSLDTASTQRPEALSGTPQAIEFLPLLADALGLNLVADHHTRSERFSLPRNPVKLADLLPVAARRFQLVLRVSDGYLHARSRYWPDRDDEEVPYPYPERWIAAKRAGDGVTLGDLAIMATLSEPRIAGLRAYVDDGTHLRRELRVAAENRWILALMQALPENQQEQARSSEGLPLRQLSLRLRNMLARSLPHDIPWRTVRLYHREPRPAPGDRIRPPGMVYLAEPNASTPIFFFNFHH
jgi:hypothetical protein